MDEGETTPGGSNALSTGIGVGAGIVGAMVAVGLILGIASHTPGGPGPGVGATDQADGHGLTAPGTVPGTEPDAGTGGGSLSPTELARENDAIEFEARWPALPEAPQLQARFEAEARDSLASLEAESRQAMAEFDTDIRYGFSSDWQRAGKGGALISLVLTQYAFTGGAHGNTGFDSLLYDTEAGASLVVADLFEGQALPTPLKGEICKALVSAKIERTGSADVFGEPIVCTPDQLDTVLEAAVLVVRGPASGEGFTGIEAIFAQYTVGSYAEGPYAVSVPSALFVQALKPEYRAAFASDVSLTER